MFASKTLTEHLARGVVGLTALVLALVLADTSWVFPVALLPLGLLALRGCPTCWLLGLAETIAAKLTGRPADAACVDGGCSRRSRPKPSVDRMLRDLLGP